LIRKRQFFRQIIGRKHFLKYNIGPCFQRKIRRSRLRFEGFDGFSAVGFFHLNRSLMTSVVGALVTYLIVLLQFKQADMRQ
jgi:hypothetical protein